jgi:quinolinate synthase
MKTPMNHQLYPDAVLGRGFAGQSALFERSADSADAETLSAEIRELAREKEAVILAHNYQVPEVQDVADFVGDSLGLSLEAQKASARRIVFCGVHFMAESAKVLNPDKRVFLPHIAAGCSLADSITAESLEDWRARYPNHAVVTYINSSAEVKALSDICCTSANAAKVVASIPRDRPVLFIPDQSLGHYVAQQLGRELILWPGYCPTHHRILARDVRELKREHPQAKVVVHPECTSDVIALADAVASTSGILRYARESPAREFIIGTEVALLHRLRKENPAKTFYPASLLADCPNMKLNTIEKMVWSLEDMVYRVAVPPDIADRARKAIDRMLEIT